MTDTDKYEGDTSASNRWKHEMKVLCNAILNDANSRVHLKAYANSYLHGGLKERKKND